MSRMNSCRLAWSESLTNLLSQLSQSQWRVAEGGPPARYVADQRFPVTAKGGLNGKVVIGLSQDDAATMLHLFLQDETLAADKADDSQREALEELLRQWSGLAASSLKASFGEIALTVGQGEPVTEADASDMIVVTDGLRIVRAQLEWDASLLETLNHATSIPTDSASCKPGSQVERLLCEGNLGLLMDVELNVILRFGGRRTLLREVLELSPGAVLELDREIQEPVDLLLNDRVIARGEVVVVDGNYGLRVSEVASPQQRVNSL